MKMMRSTSITSTRGTTLISARDEATRRLRPDRPDEAPADGASFGMLSGPLGEVPFGDIQEFHREIVHLRGEQFHPLRQVVVEEHRRNRRREPHCCRNQ